MATKHGARKWAENPDDPSKMYESDEDYIILLDADDNLVYEGRFDGYWEDWARDYFFEHFVWVDVYNLYLGRTGEWEDWSLEKLTAEEVEARLAGLAEQDRVFWFSNDCFDKYCFDDDLIDFCAGGMPVSWVSAFVGHDGGEDPCGCLWSDCNSVSYRVEVTPAVPRGGVSFERRRLVCLNASSGSGRVAVGCCEAGRDAGGSFDSAASHCEPAEVACSLVATEATTSIALAR